jgi:hypothetical protein
MARPTKPLQPEQGVPVEQALVTPAYRPEVLLALQQQQSSQAINNECALIRQEIGSLRGELQGIKDTQTITSGAINSLKRFHHIVIGVVIAVAGLITVIWFLVGSKVTTLLKVADEKQFCEEHPMAVDGKGVTICER